MGAREFKMKVTTKDLKDANYNNLMIRLQLTQQKIEKIIKKIEETRNKVDFGMTQLVKVNDYCSECDFIYIILKNHIKQSILQVLDKTTIDIADQI